MTDLGKGLLIGVKAIRCMVDGGPERLFGETVTPKDDLLVANG